MKKIGIYKITSPSGKIYIGQSVNIKKRFLDYKGLRCKAQRKVYLSLKKYGSDNHKFEIIHICDIEQLNELERYYQDFYDCIGNHGLNLILTDTATMRREFSSESILKISKASKNRVCSEETKAKLRIASTGKIHSEATKKRFVEIGKNRSREAIMKMHKEGYKHSDEAKLKMSIAHTGKKLSQSAINDIVERQQKIILNNQTGIFYIGVKEAAMYNGIHAGTLRGKLSGHLKNNTNLIYA